MIRNFARSVTKSSNLKDKSIGSSRNFVCPRGHIERRFGGWQWFYITLPIWLSETLDFIGVSKP